MVLMEGSEPDDHEQIAYLTSDQISFGTNTAFMHQEPVQVRLQSSLEIDSRKLLVRNHVDFIQINSRSYPHSELNWSELLKVFCPEENGLLPLVFKPSKFTKIIC